MAIVGWLFFVICALGSVICSLGFLFIIAPQINKSEGIFGFLACGILCAFFTYFVYTGYPFTISIK